MVLDQQSVADLARGCAILGAGGGGDVGLVLDATQRAVAEHGPVAVVAPDELGDGLVMPCAFIGAPTVALEKGWHGDEGLWLRQEVETLTGQRVVALMSPEIGGVNGVISVYWAAKAGLPIVDADCVGRAIPLVSQMATRLRGIPVTPCILIDERRNVVVIRTAGSGLLDTVIQTNVAALGGWCSAAICLMTGAEAARAAFLGTVTRAVAIGRAVAEASGDSVGAVCAAVGAVELISGRVADVERETSGGMVHGSLVVAEPEGSGRIVRVVFQNENLVALEEGEALALVPDVIAVLDLHTGEAISNERLRYGQRVVVVAFACEPLLRTEAGLALCGPAAFGLDVPYVPIEELSVVAS